MVLICAAVMGSGGGLAVAAALQRERDYEPN